MSRGASLQLGGKGRKLRYDLNAVAEIGDKLGLRIRMDHFKEDLFGVPLPMSAYRTILWAGLIHAEPDLTEREVGGWVDQDNMGEVLLVFFGLFGLGALPVATQQQVADALGVTLPESDTRLQAV